MITYVNQQKHNGSYFFLETAGGIHSPVMSGTAQVDFYRTLRLPTLLIGDSKLGGISTTLSSFESLLIRGYDIPLVLLFDQPTYKNHTMIQDKINQIKKGIKVVIAPSPPAYQQDLLQERESMEKYYSQLDGYLLPTIDYLDKKHHERFDRLESMSEKSRSTFWWPFTQHDLVKDVTVIDSAHDDYFTTYENKEDELKPKEMFDSCASWWTQGLGHGNPTLTLSAAHAAGRYGHVIFPESTNEPALSLAETVLEKDNWASRVFFSDNGSTAMEVALKMALASTAKRYGFDIKAPVEILGIEGSYHGDTIGVMDACSPHVYNDQVQWYEPKGHWLKPPSVHISQGRPYIKLPTEILEHHKNSSSSKIYYNSMNEIYSVDKKGHSRDENLTETYKSYIRGELNALKAQKRRIGTLLMEPVLMGAGGMIFVDPLFQRVLIDVVRSEGSELLYNEKNENTGDKNSWQGLPIVFDEVFTGWYRLGRKSASEFLGVTPDITAYAKTLTGGLLPLALTVTKESIYDVFLSKNKPDCLLHGHSYTAHPMGCAVAKASIDKLDEMSVDKKGSWSHFQKQWDNDSLWSMWSPQLLNKISHMKNIEGVMALGSVLAIELKDNQNKGYGSSVSSDIIQKLRKTEFKIDNEETGISLYARPLGNIIYLMTSQITTPERVALCEKAILQTLQSEH
ncbi:pyridoxal phosphate-dependent transferase [Pilobolus umbonatus]|nr:pyridoxal phosphate-dependent transferase [Pilobolus umbonatus]